MGACHVSINYSQILPSGILSYYGVRRFVLIWRGLQQIRNRWSNEKCDPLFEIKIKNCRRRAIIFHWRHNKLFLEDYSKSLTRVEWKFEIKNESIIIIFDSINANFNDIFVNFLPNKNNYSRTIFSLIYIKIPTQNYWI